MTASSTHEEEGQPSTPHFPDPDLVRDASLKFRWQPEAKLRSVLAEFGRLPRSGQEELVHNLVGIQSRFDLKRKGNRRFSSLEQTRHLRSIEMQARKLLGLLGVNVANFSRDEFLDPRSDLDVGRHVSIVQSREDAATLDFVGASILWLTIPNISGRPAGETSGDCALVNRWESLIRQQTKENSDRARKALAGVCWLYQKAKSAADSNDPQNAGADSNSVSGRARGGARNSPNQKGQAIRDAFALYRHMRSRYPESGRPPALGPPLRRFVRAVGTLLQIEISEKEIDEAWRLPRKRGSKTK